MTIEEKYYEENIRGLNDEPYSQLPVEYKKAMRETLGFAFYCLGLSTEKIRMDVNKFVYDFITGD